jgi:hypothetical protein
MAWRYTRAGKEFDRPNSETGLHVEGPLTVEDWKTIIVDIPGRDRKPNQKRP